MELDPRCSQVFDRLKYLDVGLACGPSDVIGGEIRFMIYRRLNVSLVKFIRLKSMYLSKSAEPVKFLAAVIINDIGERLICKLDEQAINGPREAHVAERSTDLCTASLIEPADILSGQVPKGFNNTVDIWIAMPSPML